MRVAMDGSVPADLDYGQWHLPLVDDVEQIRADIEKLENVSRQYTLVEAVKMISASRCARVSFDKHTDDEPVAVTIDRAERLMESGHLSPFEHVARPVDDHGKGQKVPDYGMWSAEWTEFVGNFRGWVQFRKELPNEDRFDLHQAAMQAAARA
jgi:hypothetical protein